MKIYILLLILIISILINYYPKISYYNHIKKSTFDKYDLDINEVKRFYSFRSYIYYLRFKDIKFNLMDKIELYNYLKNNNINFCRCYYKSYINFDIKLLLTNLIKDNKSFVVKPSHLSEKKLCYVIKDGINKINNKKITADIIQKEINKSIMDKAYYTESKKLKECRPGIIVQESLDVNGFINEWKCFCVWGKVIFSIWRKDHKRDEVILDSNFKLYNIGFYNNKVKLPSFYKDIYNVAEKLSKNIPFIRIDILWNETKFVVNELDICPSGHYGLHNEKLLIKLIKDGYGIKYSKLNLIYELKAYFNFFHNRMEDIVS